MSTVAEFPVGASVVCHFSCVGQWLSPDMKGELTNEVLFGETAQVLELRGGYMRIRLDHDGYEGWVDARHFSRHSGPPLDLRSCPVVGDMCARLTGGGRTLWLTLGTPLPEWDEGFCFLAGQRYEYHGRLAPLDAISAEKLKELGHALLGIPYRWGGRSCMGFDCSGLMQILYRVAGQAIGRDTLQQLTEGQRLTDLAQAHLGDLAFFQSGPEQTRHVGLVLPDSQILHCSGSVRTDDLTPEGIRHRLTGVLTHQMREIRRVLR